MKLPCFLAISGEPQRSILSQIALERMKKSSGSHLPQRHHFDLTPPLESLVVAIASFSIPASLFK